MKKMSVGKRIIGTAAIPGGVLLLFAILCAIQGTSLIGSKDHVVLLVRSVATVTLTSFALSLNLNSGRFDFSLGSLALLSSVVSASLAIRYGLGPGAMLVISLGAGLLLGLFSGILYVTLRLPAIITSLGVALMYEAIAFIFTDGKGVSFGTYQELTAFASDMKGLLLVIVISTALMIFLFNYSSFGYHYQALRFGQNIACDTGLREVGNAIACYGISGILMGMEGYITASLSGTIQMNLNFGSIGVMFTAFLPMFIGSFIGRYINSYIGMVLGALTSGLMSLGFVRLGLPSEVQSLVSAFALVLFLIYLNNEQGIVRFLVPKKTKEAVDG